MYMVNDGTVKDTEEDKWRSEEECIEANNLKKHLSYKYIKLCSSRLETRKESTVTYEPLVVGTVPRAAARHPAIVVYDFRNYLLPVGVSSVLLQLVFRCFPDFEKVLPELGNTGRLCGVISGIWFFRRLYLLHPDCLRTWEISACSLSMSSIYDISNLISNHLYLMISTCGSCWLLCQWWEIVEVPAVLEFAHIKTT